MSRKLSFLSPKFEREPSLETVWTRMRSPSLSTSSNNAPTSPTLDLNKYRNMINIIASTSQFVYSKSCTDNIGLNKSSCYNRYGIFLGKTLDPADLDQLAKSLLNIGTYKSTTCKMINDMIVKEFDNRQEHTVLRGNSITTKLEVLYCSMLLFTPI